MGPLKFGLLESPAAWLSGAAVLLGIVSGLCAWSYSAGRSDARTACEEANNAAIVAGAQDASARLENGHVAEVFAQARNATREQALQTVEKEVIRYVERKAPKVQTASHAGSAGGPVSGAGSAGPQKDAPDADADRPGCGLDADGLRLWTAAGLGQLSAAAGGADAGLQLAARGTGLRLSAGSAGQPHPMDERAAPLPRPPF